MTLNKTESQKYGSASDVTRYVVSIKATCAPISCYLHSVELSTTGVVLISLEPAALIMHLRLKLVMNARGKTKPHLRRYYAFQSVLMGCEDVYRERLAYQS